MSKKSGLKKEIARLKEEIRLDCRAYTRTSCESEYYKLGKEIKREQKELRVLEAELKGVPVLQTFEEYYEGLDWMSDLNDLNIRTAMARGARWGQANPGSEI